MVSDQSPNELHHQLLPQQARKGHVSPLLRFGGELVKWVVPFKGQTHFISFAPRTFYRVEPRRPCNIAKFGSSFIFWLVCAVCQGICNIYNGYIWSSFFKIWEWENFWATEENYRNTWAWRKNPWFCIPATSFTARTFYRIGSRRPCNIATLSPELWDSFAQRFAQPNVCQETSPYFLFRLRTCVAS